MRRLCALALMAVFILATLVACTTRNDYSTTVNVYGPFQQCSVIFLPTGRGEVRFGEGGVEVTGPSSIQVGTVAYNVDLTSCAATTTTTTEHPA